MMVCPRKVVSLLEILRIYANVYATTAHCLGTCVSTLNQQGELGGDLVEVLLQNLTTAEHHCEMAGLEMTRTQIHRVVKILDRNIDLSSAGMADRLVELENRLEDELKMQLFFQLPVAKRDYFDEPRRGWESVLRVFPDATSDVEEMRRCFALSRYPACVFHSMQVLEHRVIKLGKTLNVGDHKTGWAATTNELKQILKTPFTDRTDWEREHFGFVEQMNATVEALKTAWRNKIDHASGRLAILPGDFNPDIAEEIMAATKGFMRRLATEMPPQSRSANAIP
jgi:hypothetical protein